MESRVNYFNQQTVVERVIGMEQILKLHHAWMLGHKKGKRANLSGANLSGMDLRGVKLYGAELSNVNLSNADLRCANLSNANMDHVDLSDAKLSGASLYGANLRGSNLSHADMSGVRLNTQDLNISDLRSAYESGAILTGEYLFSHGGSKYLKTLRIEPWHVAYTNDMLQIRDNMHPIDQWRHWDTLEGRNWIAKMDEDTLKWAERLLPLVLQIIDASPAEPT